MPRRNRPHHELDRMLVAVLILVTAGPSIAILVGFFATIGGRRLGLW